MGDMEQDTHRKRDREREAQRGITLLAIVTMYNQQQQPLQQVTKSLYSDSLRATALYTNYTNGPNLGYQRG